MSTNFDFLRKINFDLYKIISDAESLYRDEYFEQCMTQTRRFGEQICKTLLEQNGQQASSFDNMIATLQDKSQGSDQEKEFIEDLYFLKKNGNKSVHSAQVKKEAMTALECLKRAFEVAINFSVYSQGAPSSILKLDYDIDLLITKEKSKKSLTEKYKEAKQQEIKTQPAKKAATNTIQRTKTRQTKAQNTYQQDKIQQTEFKIPLFWKFMAVLTGFSGFILAILSLLIKIKG